MRKVVAVYCALSIVAWLGLGLAVNYAGAPPVLLLGWVVAAPGAFVGVFQLLAFPLRYTVFGSPRTRFPNEPAERFSGSWGGVGALRGSVPFVSWSVFASGLGVTVFPAGRAFVPWTAFRKARRKLLFGVELHHASPEVRRLTVPGSVFERIRPRLEQSGCQLPQN